ncbi:MAG: hypothetical protein ABJC89_01395 [Acidobacteriota bacterium]
MGLLTGALALTMLVEQARPSARGPESPLKPIDDPEAYAVYASVLAGDSPAHAASARRLVFLKETSTNQSCMPSGKPLEGEWRPVVDNFKSENAQVRAIRPGFSLGLPYVVVPTEEIQALFRAPQDAATLGWSGFYQQYPDSGGYISVSAVGFDRPKTRAMVYMANACGGLCGGGTHHLLEKVNNAWREATLPGLSSCMWVS